MNDSKTPLSEMRERIDSIDRQIQQLISERANHARTVAKVKVKRALADELLFGKLADGGVVTLSVADGELKVECKAAAKLPAIVE